MNIEDFDWDDLYKKAEKFIQKYIPEAVVNLNVRTVVGASPIVEVTFPEKLNKAAVENLCKEKCFRKGRRFNIGGARMYRSKIIFAADGSLK